MSLNAAEMARRQFRDIARIAGLVQGFPVSRKPARHLQASSGLFYEVFAQYDPENLLLRQAHREVLEQRLESGRLDTSPLTKPRRAFPDSLPRAAGEEKEPLNKALSPWLSRSKVLRHLKF